MFIEVFVLDAVANDQTGMDMGGGVGIGEDDIGVDENPHTAVIIAMITAIAKDIFMVVANILSI